MGLRKATSEIIYPFTPRSSSDRSALTGISDTVLVVAETSDTAPAGAPSWMEDYSAALESVAPDTDGIRYVFRIKTPIGWASKSFLVPMTGGIIRVSADGDPSSALMVNTYNLPDIENAEVVWAELEPSRAIFYLPRVQSISLYNEWRDHDPSNRPMSVPDNPDHKISDSSGGALRLSDGYNCSVRYDETTGELLVSGAPGAGKGKPAGFPWDTDAPDIFDGVRSVNGVNIDGDAPIKLGTSLVPEDIPGGLRIKTRG